MLNVISLGVLSNSTLELNILTNTLQSVNYSDFIIDFILKNKRESANKKNLLWPKDVTCIKLFEIINSSKNDAETLMREYLEKYFYTRENFEEEYNCHLRDEGKNYKGYWSFEAAAITKIMGLDDSGYINSPYYPKDMLHGDLPGYTYQMPADDTPHLSEKEKPKKKW